MDKTTEVHQTKKMLKAFKWIVFLLIIIVCMPPFSIHTGNGSKKNHPSTEHKRDENKKKSTDSEDKNNKLSLNFLPVA